MVRVIIIRHSERLDFTYPLYWLTCIGQFWADTPLTNNGKKMALTKGQELKSTINPHNIYTSPYIRTIATTEQIAQSFPEAKIIIEPLLSEYQPYYRHSITKYPKGIPIENTPFRFPETLIDFDKRAEYIIEHMMKNNDKDFIIVTHGEFIRFSVEWLNKKFEDLKLYIKSIDYLTTVSFEYDPTNGKINKTSVKIDR